MKDAEKHKSYYDIIADDQEILKIVVQIMNGMSSTATELQKYLLYWDKYKSLWVRKFFFVFFFVIAFSVLTISYYLFRRLIRRHLYVSTLRRIAPPSSSMRRLVSTATIRTTYKVKTITMS